MEIQFFHFNCRYTMCFQNFQNNFRYCLYGCIVCFFSIGKSICFPKLYILCRFVAEWTVYMFTSRHLVYAKYNCNFYSTSILYFISPQVYNTKPDSSGQQNVTTHDLICCSAERITCHSFVHLILVILHFDWFDHNVKGVDSINDSLTRLGKCFNVTSIADKKALHDTNDIDFDWDQTFHYGLKSKMIFHIWSSKLIGRVFSRLCLQWKVNFVYFFSTVYSDLRLTIHTLDTGTNALHDIVRTNNTLSTLQQISASVVRSYYYLYSELIYFVTAKFCGLDEDDVEGSWIDGSI